MGRIFFDRFSGPRAWTKFVVGRLCTFLTNDALNLSRIFGPRAKSYCLYCIIKIFGPRAPIFRREIIFTNFCFREIDIQYLQIIQNRHISNSSIDLLFQMCTQEVSQLMGIHTRCGHANCSWPVVVQMGQLVGQHLNSK